MKKKNQFTTAFSTGKIKKIMQCDEDIGKIAAGTPVVVSTCLELFIKDLTSKAAQIAQQNNATTINPSHIKQIIQNEKLFDFLRSHTENIPETSSSTNHNNEKSTVKLEVSQKPTTNENKEQKSEEGKKRGRPKKSKPVEDEDVPIKKKKQTKLNENTPKPTNPSTLTNQSAPTSLQAEKATPIVTPLVPKPVVAPINFDNDNYD